MDEQKQKIKKPHKKMSNKLFTGIWGSLLALLMVGIITLNVVLLKYSSLITRSLGHQTVATVNLDTSGDSDYFKSAFATEADLLAHETEISRQIEAEGIVLVKNDQNALPLQKGAKISIFGQASTQFRYGGGGSGAIDETNVQSLKEAFTQEGFDVNETLWTMYQDSGLKIPKEVKPDDFSAEVEKSFAAYGDVAIFVFSRPAHEATDLAEKEVSLSKDEQALLTYINAHFDRVIVLLNIANAVELGWLNEYEHIQGALWVGYPGQQGMISIPRAVNGTDGWWIPMLTARKAQLRLKISAMGAWKTAITAWARRIPMWFMAKEFTSVIAIMKRAMRIRYWGREMQTAERALRTTRRGTMARKCCIPLATD